MSLPYYDLNTYFQSIFGSRTHKVAIDAGFTCPNRDGRLGTSGCIYCNAQGSGTGRYQEGLSITDQITAAKAYLGRRFKARRFIAYFQSFTNTYGPLERLKRAYDEALAVEGVVGLSIGTRPDCVDGAVLNLVEGYAARCLVWMEYGLQSAHDRTLALIRRGHDFKAFQRAVALTQNRGIRICAHIILGLPGETRKDMLETARVLSGMGIDGVKIHLLYVVKGTEMENLLRRGRYECLSMAQYADLVCECISLLPKTMVIQRLTGDPHPKELAAPLWALEKSATRALILQTFKDRGLYQGKHYNHELGIKN